MVLMWILVALVFAVLAGADPPLVEHSDASNGLNMMTEGQKKSLLAQYTAQYNATYGALPESPYNYSRTIPLGISYQTGAGWMG